MVKLRAEVKQRMPQLKCGKFAIHWSFILLMIYKGFKRGADPGTPESTVLGLDKRLFGHLDLEAINGQEQHGRFPLQQR